MPAHITEILVYSSTKVFLVRPSALWHLQQHQKKIQFYTKGLLVELSVSPPPTLLHIRMNVLYLDLLVDRELFMLDVVHFNHQDVGRGQRFKLWTQICFWYLTRETKVTTINIKIIINYKYFCWVERRPSKALCFWNTPPGVRTKQERKHFKLKLNTKQLSDMHSQLVGLWWAA